MHFMALEGHGVKGTGNMDCPVCRGARLVEIEIELKGELVRMHSCSRCDTRWWERNGEQLALDNVLELATVRK